MVFALYEMKVVLAEVLRGVTSPRSRPRHPVRILRRRVALAPSAGSPVVVDAVAADGAASPRRRVPNLGGLTAAVAGRPAPSLAPVEKCLRDDQKVAL
jgi:hypothetical protein